MKGDSWLQKILYLAMVALGSYILYKGCGILLDQAEKRGVLEEGTVQRTLEDAAIRTYAPGYAAVVEERNKPDWMAGWMKQLVPVYSYVAEGQLSRETEAAMLQNGEYQETNVQNTGLESETQSPEQGQTDIASENKVAVREQADVSESGGGSGADTADSVEASANPAFSISNTLREQLQDFDYLLMNYYTVDGGTAADEQLLDADKLLEMDMSIEQNSEVPQILIYHTHSQETFIDSEEGNTEESIVGMGKILEEELETYGYQVLHDEGVYDLVNGVLDRSAAYDYAREAVEQILEEYPTIEVIIDLHRDGVEGQKFVTEIDGKPASMIMFFNGLSRNEFAEPLYWLQNPYLEENLAFSLQLQLAAREQYPGFTRNIYLKAERFNLHLRPRSLLIEAGTQLNTVEEERNAMEPLAKLLHQVLSGAYS